jgi:hypothetical protein
MIDRILSTDLVTHKSAASRTSSIKTQSTTTTVRERKRQIIYGAGSMDRTHPEWVVEIRSVTSGLIIEYAGAAKLDT